MRVRGVLFDFSGTLFRLEGENEWLHTALEATGVQLDNAARNELLDRLTDPLGPGESLPPRLQESWQRRDLDPAVHHEVYAHLLRAYGLSDDLAEAIYGQLTCPDNWFPYPDTARTLRALRDSGLVIGVVSNIAWDIRTAFDRHDLRDLVDTFVLSYEFGAMKPDPAIFRHACAELDLAPTEAMMIGDSVSADGAAEALGTRFVAVDPLPTARRPRGLLEACGLT